MGRCKRVAVGFLATDIVRPLLKISRMAVEESNRWERRTWPELQRLAAEVPEAGIHFQSKESSSAHTAALTHTYRGARVPAGQRRGERVQGAAF